MGRHIRRIIRLTIVEGSKQYTRAPILNALVHLVCQGGMRRLQTLKHPVDCGPDGWEVAALGEVVAVIAAVTRMGAFTACPVEANATVEVVPSLVSITPNAFIASNNMHTLIAMTGKVNIPKRNTGEMTTSKTTSAVRGERCNANLRLANARVLSNVFVAGSRLQVTHDQVMAGEIAG